MIFLALKNLDMTVLNRHGSKLKTTQASFNALFFFYVFLSVLVLVADAKELPDL